jgi:hypothetical protein
VPTAARNADGVFYSGLLKVPVDGEYAFSLEANAGALLRIHDATVIDADFGYPGGQMREGRIRLQAGLHPFRLYWLRKSSGTPFLKFYWSGPGIAKEIVPAGVLFHASGRQN